MTTQGGEVEGQALARRLLSSLDARQRPDWEAFDGVYREWLLHVAAGCRSRYPALDRHFQSPQEVVQSFLAEKVYPPEQARRMLTGPANGECPLRPRLATSLRNYCVDVLRSPAAVHHTEPSEALEWIEAPEPDPLPDVEDLIALIRRQLKAIRSSLPVSAGAPYRLALLLRLRLDWAGVLNGVELPQSGGTGRVEVSLADLERYIAWESSEAETRFGESPLTLGSAWEGLRPRLLAAVERRLSSRDVAGVLRVPRDLWDQWISRGRRHLRQQLGGEYAEVFALWP
jgi:DNA-directed RNA polymerase specialized sigma24 family protein